MEFSSLMNCDDDQMGVNLQPAFRPFHNMSNNREESDHENNVNEDFEDFKEPQNIDQLMESETLKFAMGQMR